MGLLKAILISFIFLAICSSISDALIFDMYDIDVNIVDDNGAPVERANVYISFEKNTSSGTKMYAIKAVTGLEGKFEATGSGNGHISYGATKDGYYQSHYSYYFPGQKDVRTQKREFNIILRKIENPVPMYARQAKIVIPVVGKDVGFDLVEYDWVVPYGKGKNSDFIFYLSRKFTAWNEQDCELYVKLLGKYNGIQLHSEDRQNGSVFKLYRYAPESNYVQNIQLLINAHNGSWKSNVKNTDNYYFRIREQEKDGKLYKAIYGKISGHIDFTPINSKTAKITFNYYLNPDYTRNLEFDPKRNLFGIIPDLERISEP